MAKSTFRKRVLIVLCALAATPAILLAIGLLVLDSEWGRRTVADQLMAATADGPVSIALGGIAPGLPGHLEVRDLVLSDAEGPFARVGSAVVDWSLLSLLGGRLDIEAIAVRQASLDRVPTLPESPEPEIAPPTEPLSFSFPAPPIAVALGGFTLDALDLGADIIGRPVRVTADLSGGLDASRAALAGRIDIDDGTLPESGSTSESGSTGTLILDIEIDPATGTLRASIDAKEPAGGLLATLADVPGRPALDLTLVGEGTPEDWRGRLAGGFGDGARAELALALVREQTAHAISIEGTAQPSLFLPADIAPLIGEVVPLSVSVRLRDDGFIELTAFDVRPRAGTVSATARLTPDGLPDQARVTVAVPDLAPLSEQAGVALTGAIGLTAQLEDAGKRAVLTITGDASADGTPVERLDLSLHAHAERMLANLPTSMAVRWEGSVGVPIYGDLDLPELLGPRLSLEGSARVDVERLDVAIERFGLTTDAARIELTGTLHEATRIDGRLTATAQDLTRFRDLAGLELSGALDLVADISGALDPLSVQVAADLAGLSLQTGLPEVDGILGADPLVTAGITYQGDSLSIIGLDVQARHASLSGDADLDLATGALSARIDVAAPSLAPIGEAVGTPLRGTMGVALAVGGTFDEPAASASWRVGDLAAGGSPVGTVTGSVSAVDLTGVPNGRLDLQLATDQGRIETGTDFRLDGDLLSLANVRLDGLGLAVTGGVEADLTGPTAEGALRIRAEDLGVLGEAFALPLGSGRVSADVSLSGAAGQSARLDGRIEGLSVGGSDAGEPVTIGLVEIAVSLAELTASPRGDGSITISEIDAAPARIERITLQAASDGKTAQADLRLDGTVSDRGKERPIALSAAMDGRLDASPVTARVQSLEASFGDDLAARLSRPVNLALGEVTSVDDLALDIVAFEQTGSLTGRGTLDPARLDMRLALRDLPAALAGLVDPTLELQGGVDGNLTVAGPIENPVVDLDIGTSGIQSTDPEFAALPPLVADLVVGLRDRAVRARLTGGVGDGAGVEVTLATNLVSGGRGAPPTMGLDQSLSGSIDGLVRLDRASGFLPLGDLQMSGDMTLDITLAGTLADPLVTGAARLDDVGVEYPEFGVDYRAVNMEALGEADRLVIRTLSAESVSGGTVTGSGFASFDVDSGNPVDIRIAARQFTAVQMDTATIVLSSDLALTGARPSYLLAGTVTVEPSEIRIPSALPTSVTSLDVTEIGVDGQVLNPQEPEVAQEADAPLALDMVIDVPGRVFVRGRGLEAELEGRLLVKGLADDPLVTGGIGVKEGTFDALGQNFIFNKGLVSFDGAPVDNPNLDVKLTAEVADILAIVGVDGTARNPNLVLSSEPSLPRDEILARLLFGQAQAELTPLQALKLAQSAAQLSGGFGSGPGITDQLRESLGVDTLDVSTGGVGEDAAGPSLSVGKYIADGVFLRLEQGLSGADSRAVVEVELTDNITLETDVGADSASRAGINWKLDY
jgi:translocation and assembly module TamB